MRLPFIQPYLDMRDGLGHQHKLPPFTFADAMAQMFWDDQTEREEMIEDWEEIIRHSQDPDAPTDLIPHPTEPNTLVFDNEGDYPTRYLGAIPPQKPSKHIMYLSGTQEGTYIKLGKHFWYTQRQQKRLTLAIRAVSTRHLFPYAKLMSRSVGQSCSISETPNTSCPHWVA